MSRPNAPTLADVAAEANVSTATISRVLNEPDKVAKATRDRVETAIAQLGYTPNFGGRALASNRSNVVGAIIPSLSNAMFANGVQAFQEALAEAGVNLLIATTDDDPDQEFRHIRALVSHGAGALMLVGHDRPQETRDFLAKRNVAHVIAWAYRDDAEHLCAGFDNFAAAFDAAQHVLNAGHRRIGLISGLTKGNDRARDRAMGIQQAVRDFGDGACLTQKIERKYRLAYGAEAFAEIIQSNPTAIMCGNDVLAAGAMMKAREMGLDVPRDISVIGFDDIGLASVVSPPMTTVRIPQIEMGRAAARLLLTQLDGETAQKSLSFETEFISRGTLAAPSK